MKYPLSKYFGAVVLAVFLCTAVSWGQVVGVSGPYDVRVSSTSLEGTFNINIVGGYIGGVSAGPMSMEFVGYTTPPIPNYPSQWPAYCIDLNTQIAPPNTFQGMATLFSSPLQPSIPDPEWLSVNAARKAAYLYDTFAGSVVNSDQGAGLQLAIWSVLYGTSQGNGIYNHTAVFTETASSAITGQELGFLTAADNAGWGNYLTDPKYAATWWQLKLNGTGVQSLIGPVPEPPETIAAGLLVIAVLAGLELRKKARKV